MENRTYGALPENLGIFDINCDETMAYLYMPIMLPGMDFPKMGNRLYKFLPLILAAGADFFNSLENIPCNERIEKVRENYVYITAKHGFIPPDSYQNRPGWHSDGFMTDDINYVWVDRNPTIYNSSDFILSQNDELSMLEMIEQADEKNNITFPEKSLLKLDQFCIHRVPEMKEGGYRTFVKISISKDKYDLRGNTHNHDLRYTWDMKERQPGRNIPQSKIGGKQ